VNRNARAGFLLPLLVALTVGLTSCARVPTSIPTISDLSGHWMHRSDGLEATLVLRADKSFSLTDVPAGVVRGDESSSGGIPRGEPVSLAGTWTIGSKSGQTVDANGEPFIELNLPPNSYSTCIGLEVRSVGKSTRLSIELGHPDKPLTYDFVR
jgi:hypothetical protein